MQQWRTIDGDDVYRQQETAVVAEAAAVVEDELEGRRPPTRDYGNKRQQQETTETATRDGGDSGLATMTVVAYSDFRGWRWRRTMALINASTQELVVDNNGEGTRPQQETTATVTSDSDKRWRRQRIGDDDCGGLRQLPRTAMATDDDGID